ncbi:MAG: bifunctional phosphoribosylaminoimidazolecarboxamide formyltransferase/IMP cyclohydrolase [Candidatus Cloacimonadia bacterium]
MKYALISVSDKTGLVPLAEAMINKGYKLISTGGTAKHLKDNGLSVDLVEDISGFPEILNGRVKTLHPMVFGGILADRRNEKHLSELAKHKIPQIDIVVVNLYPFVELISKGESDLMTMIENIDIGGVTLIRAAAKNYHSTAIISDVNDYQKVIDELDQEGRITEPTRKKLACKAFATTSHYDRSIYQFLSKEEQQEEKMESLFPNWTQETLRYGENPHQKGVFLSPKDESLIDVIWGKQLSYNNYLDINGALKLIYRFERPTVAILKHTNPCGVASADSLSGAYDDCLATDTLSPFGGIVVVNRPLDMETAERINKVFTEIIVAPEYPEEVLTFLQKKKDRRLVVYNQKGLQKMAESNTYTSCLNGLLSQTIDMKMEDQGGWRVVTKREPTEQEWASLKFAWNVVSTLKSNAIALTNDERTIGLGMGQTSRIDSVEFAVYRAKKFNHEIEGAVCASDGFFPFRDGVDYLSKQGIKAIIQPGGSKGDQEVIKACDELGICMIFTGVRHFSH